MSQHLIGEEQNSGASIEFIEHRTRPPPRYLEQVIAQPLGKNSKEEHYIDMEKVAILKMIAE